MLNALIVGKVKIMGKRNGDYYTCDGKVGCEETAFVGRTTVKRALTEDELKRTPYDPKDKAKEREVSVGGQTPEGWTLQGDLWLCPSCTASHDEWRNTPAKKWK